MREKLEAALKKANLKGFEMSYITLELKQFDRTVKDWCATCLKIDNAETQRITSILKDALAQIAINPVAATPIVKAPAVEHVFAEEIIEEAPVVEESVKATTKAVSTK